MRPSLRFLVGVVLAWAGVRAATLGILPGASIFRVPAGEAHPAPEPPPVAATQFPSIEPIAPADASLMQTGVVIDKWLFFWRKPCLLIARKTLLC